MQYYLKKHWKINALIFLLQILYAASAVFPSVCMMYMTQGIIERNLKYFVFWLMLEFGVYLCMMALDILRSWAKSRAIRDMNNDLRSDIAATLLDSDHREYHTSQTGEHLSRLTNDVNQIKTLAWDSMYGIISIVAQVLFSCIFLGQLHWSLILLSAVSSVIMLYSPRLVGKRMEAISKENAAAQGIATSRIKDLLSGMDVLRTYGRTARFLEGNREASDILEAGRHKFTCNQTFANQFIMLITLLSQFGSIMVIAILSINGTILQGAILGGGNLVGTVSSGLSQVSQMLLSIRSSRPYFEKITARAQSLTEEDAPAAAMNTAITVENLSFSYDNKPVLYQADFRFEKGGKYALTGPSGCGKSTLLKLLLGWLPDYSGAIFFDSTNVKEYTSRQLQQSMSYIEQNVCLFNTTIRDNITLGGGFTDAQLEEALQCSALIHDLANLPQGLDTPVGEDGSNLSGGQKQRVAIARALIHNRSILLIDEGTSALDQKNADIVEKSLLNNPNLTLILVSHHLSQERKEQFTSVYNLEPVSIA